MELLRVQHTDSNQVRQLVGLLNAARERDDPDGWPDLPELKALDMAYGYDLRPGENYLYVPQEATDPVAAVVLDLPTWDNRHLVWCEITVHPDHRRRGHGSAIMAEVLTRVRSAGRNTIWVGVPADDAGAKAFVARFGFVFASHDARRRQVLADVDPAALDQLATDSLAAATDYRLERVVPPVSDELLSELVAVTGAINDAPMGTLSVEEELFDLRRLRDTETARALRGESVYRVAARHLDTGEVVGHSLVVRHPRRPALAYQGDTAVRREHRGHRLGLLLKIEMLRWLAEVEPPVAVIETWNHVDNAQMIRVNETLGYRLAGVFETYQLVLPSTAGSSG